MVTVSANIGADHYKTEIISLSGNKLISDESVESGGKDLGFDPKELLTSALAACTSITLRMYADRKQWNLKEIKVNVELERNEVDNKTYIKRKLELIGELNEEQRNRLLTIANACPVHKILSNSIEIETYRT